ncbi:MAG: DUF721 domain-containing protein [Flavobacteriaceae bacterium]|nr:DUF721 domain-containing protein [Flavobacteriaceae bacterium]
MSKRANEFQSIDELMKEMLQKNNLQKGIDNLAVQEAWKEVMGHGVMAYTNAIELRKNSLTVRLSSSALREELSYGKEKIISMLNENLNKTIIKTIKLL